MYQTGGLFHPLLSQRIYQSNQGLKLSAKAFWLPKGTFICLKSRGLPSDRGLICNGRGSASSLWKCPPHSVPWLLPAPLTSFPLLVFLWLPLSGPHFQMSPSSPLGFGWQVPLNTTTHPVWANPPTLTEVRALGLDRRVDGDSGAPSVTTFLWQFVMFGCNGYFRCPVPWTGVRELGCSLVGQEGLNWGSCSDICYVLLLRRGVG